MTLGRYVGSGREVPFDISSWILVVSFIVPRQSAHGRRMRSSAMPPGEHHNDVTLTMPGHDHHTSSIDDGAGIFHRNESRLQRQKATEEQRTKEEEIKAKSRAKAFTKMKSSQAVEDEWLWGDISKEDLSNETLQADSDDDMGFRMHVGEAMHTGNLDAHRNVNQPLKVVNLIDFSACDVSDIPDELLSGAAASSPPVQPAAGPAAAAPGVRPQGRRHRQC